MVFSQISSVIFALLSLIFYGITAELGCTLSQLSNPNYAIEERGVLYSPDYRIFFRGPNGYISPWHDIPLFADEERQIFNMIVEIPKFSNAKMEMKTREAMSPIGQDVKNGEMRFVSNIFPFQGYIWNYGAIPQTWENSTNVDPEMGTRGDNDPIDVIEIGGKIHKPGDVVQIKVLGVIALVDSNETDWKIVAIDINDPMASHLNNVDDVDEHFPGFLTTTREWFRIYKIPSGSPPNRFGFGGKFKDAQFARKIIMETNEFWKQLIQERNPELNTETNVPGAAFPADQEKWQRMVESKPEYGGLFQRPTNVDRFVFLNTSKLLASLMSTS